MKAKIIRLIEYFYTRFFGMKITPEVYKFIKNLSWIFVGTVIAKFLLFIIHIVGGRALGETLYGRFNLIIALAAFLTIPIFLGMPGGIIKFTSEAKQLSRKKKIISTATIFVIPSIILFSIIYYLFRSVLGNLTKMEPILIKGTIVFTALWVLFSYSEAVLQALHKMKKLSIVMIGSMIAMFAVFIVLLPIFKNVFLLYIPFMVNYFVFTLLTLIIIRKFLKASFDFAIFKKLAHYGFYMLIITIASTFLGNVDKIMLNYFLQASEVGVYQAYFNSSIVAMGILWGIFIKVFFPTVSKFKDKKSILNRLNKLSMPVTVGLAIFLPLFIFIVIRLYGYQLNLWTILLFTVATILSFFVVTYTALLNSISVESIKRTSVGMVIIFSGNIALNYFLIPKWGINGAIISTNISFLALFLYTYYYLKRMV